MDEAAAGLIKAWELYGSARYELKKCKIKRYRQHSIANVVQIVGCPTIEHGIIKVIARYSWYRL